MRLGAKFLFVVLFAAVIAMPLVAQNNPDTAVWTDKNNYVPGEIVTVTGVGFQPGEVVNLVFRTEGREDRSATSSAHENGGFTNTAFSPDSLDADRFLTLIATGTTSGFEAVNYFFDGPNDPPSCDNGANAFTVDGSVAATAGRVFKTLTEAVTALPANGPCTVNIKAGTYNETVTISGKNLTATEAQRVTIRRDPTAAYDSVVLDPSSLTGNNKKFALVVQIKFLTIEGLKITGASDTGIAVGAGASDVVVSSNHFTGNARAISISNNQPRITLVNNLIDNNGNDGISIAGPNATRSYVVNNTIVANAGKGIVISGAPNVAIVNNLSVGNSWGLQQTGGSATAAVLLKNNIFYKNSAGDVDGSVLDDTDSGNRVGLVDARPGIAGCTLVDCTNSHNTTEIVDSTGHLSAGSPAVDRGLNSLVETVQRVPAIDIDGQSRPVGPTVDVGADERPISSPPATPTITEAPPALTNQTSATFKFTGSGTLNCELDGGGFDPCSSPKTYSPLDPGEHTFKVKASNSAGESEPAVHTWTIDTAAPTSTALVTSGTEGSNGWYTTDVTVSITASKSGGTIKEIAYAINGGPETKVSGDTATLNITGEGITSIAYYSVDSLGNIEATKTLTIKIDKTAPMATLAITAGTLGKNGWYVSNVTLHATGTDANTVTCGDDLIVTEETSGTSYSLTCTDEAGWSTPTNSIELKIDKSEPTAGLNVTAGTPGSNGWYTSDVTVAAQGSDTISGPVTCTPQTQSVTTETAGQVLNATCENQAGLTKAATLTIKLDKTAPTATLAITDGTLGNNGWYTSDVTLHASGSDTISSPVTCEPDAVVSTETGGTAYTLKCTNHAGLSADTNSITVKLDKTGPTAALSVTAGTAGANGWYTSDVTVHTAGTDTISSPVTCTADQYQTTETAGAAFNGQCTNDAGLTTNATALTVKLDKTGPTNVVLAVTAGTLGNNGWYTSNVQLTTSGADTISAPVVCTAVQTLATDTVGTAFNGGCTNDAGLTTAAQPVTVKRDATAPTLNPTTTPAQLILNGAGSALPNAADATSGIASSGCNALDLTTVGAKTVACTATDNAGNANTASLNYSVYYAPAGTACMGNLGHTILQPIDADGSSVFKQKSTVPAKFRVCDANGNSIGDPGVVASFVRTLVTADAVSPVDEAIDSTTPDTAFRWDPSGAQWIFNMNTKNLSANMRYTYRITLRDGTWIDFRFALK